MTPFDFEVTVGFCNHDLDKINSLEKEIGLMLPIVNPILKVRASDHKICAHYGEVARLHGACNASESFGELAHQGGKKGARMSTKVPLKDGQRQREIMLYTARTMN